MKQIARKINGRCAVDYLLNGYYIRVHGYGDDAKLYEFDDLPSISKEIRSPKFKWDVIDVDYISYETIVSDSNFIRAFEHGVYGSIIGRKSWDKDKYIEVGKDESDTKIPHLTIEDINANDWEVLLNTESALYNILDKFENNFFTVSP